PAGEMVFVEGKYRKDTTHGTGVEAVTPTKLRRMRLAAGKWLTEQQRGVDVVRFDVIDVGPAGVREHAVGEAWWRSGTREAWPDTGWTGCSSPWNVTWGGGCPGSA